MTSIAPYHALRLALLAGLALSAAPALAADGIKPANTYAVIVGVLSWKDPKIGTFSTRHRKDRELYELLLKRGVPKENMALLLDKEATLEKINAALDRVAGKAARGSTLLFYYAGHGGLLPKGEVAFLNYDYAPASQLKLSGVAATLKRRFKGGQVLLMADCCHSGGLAAVAKELSAARINAASVTSAEASNLSAGSWAFTQCVIDALRGEGLVDQNGDGTITLGELGREVADAMKNREKQKSGASLYGLTPDFRLGPATKRAAKLAGPFRLGEYVMAPDGARTRPARVVGLKGKMYAVEFYDYSDKRVVSLEASKLKKMQFKSYKAGQKLKALWGGKFWDATILEVKDGFHLITYPGYGPEWNEWVLSDRLRP